MTEETDRPTKDLFDAIAADDVARVRRAIAAGASPDARHSYTVHERFEQPYEVTETALYAALSWKRQDAALALLALGAHPEDGGNGSPLVIAVERRLGAAVAALLSRSPPSGTLAAALQAAAASGDEAIASEILAAGATPTARALCTACAVGAESLALRLLDGGVDVNAMDGPSTPLVQAAWSGNGALVRALIARGADLQRHGSEALLHAANAGRSEVVALLLAHGVAVDVPNGYGWTPLMAAAWQDQLEVAGLLLDAGADPDHRDPAGRSVTDWARESRQRSVVGLLEARLRNR